MTTSVKSNLPQRIKTPDSFFMRELKAFHNLDTQITDSYSHNSLGNRGLRLDREVLQRNRMKEHKRGVCKDFGPGYCTNEM